MFCAFTRPRYQVSVYRTIGPLVEITCGKLIGCSAKLSLFYFFICFFSK